jgi:hypothetical protein
VDKERGDDVTAKLSAALRAASDLIAALCVAEPEDRDRALAIVRAAFPVLKRPKGAPRPPTSPERLEQLRETGRKGGLATKKKRLAAADATMVSR